MNPLLHPIHTINLQIEILPPKSTYTCLLCVHPCCCHVVQVPATSDPQYCFFISVPQFLLSHDPVHSPFCKVVFSQNMYVCSCPLCFPSLIAFLPQLLPGPQNPPPQPHFPPVCNPTPPLTPTPTNPPALPSARRLLYPSAIPPLGKPLISFTPTSLILVIFSAHDNLPCKVPFPGELIA